MARRTKTTHTGDPVEFKIRLDPAAYTPKPQVDVERILDEKALEMRASVREAYLKGVQVGYDSRPITTKYPACCVYCGHSLTDEAAKTHVRQCEHGPYVEMQQTISRLMNESNDLQDKLDKSRVTVQGLWKKIREKDQMIRGKKLQED